MQKKNKLIKTSVFFAFIALFMVFMLGATPAFAVEPIPKESGFSGFIRPGAGYMRFKSNMVASFLGFDLSDEETNSLTDSPDSQSTGVVLVPFSLAYTFASTRTQLFLGTELTDLIRFDLAQQAGIKQEIGKAGILQGGVLFTGIPAKVWKDPYVVGQNRNETRRTAHGGRLVWARIFGSQLRLQYSYRNIDLGSEKSGRFLGLTSSERNLLDRNGDRHVGEAFYRFRFAQKHTLVPQFIYARDDLDGDAMSSDTFDAQLTYTYFGKPFRLIANGFIGWADYDDDNPIFDDTQDDDRYGFQASVFYENPWGWRLFGSKPMNFFINSVFVDIDSNIDFYDEEALLFSGGLFLRW